MQEHQVLSIPWPRLCFSHWVLGTLRPLPCFNGESVGVTGCCSAAPNLLWELKTKVLIAQFKPSEGFGPCLQGV